MEPPTWALARGPRHNFSRWRDKDEKKGETKKKEARAPKRSSRKERWRRSERARLLKISLESNRSEGSRVWLEFTWGDEVMASSPIGNHRDKPMACNTAASIINTRRGFAASRDLWARGFRSETGSFSYCPFFSSKIWNVRYCICERIGGNGRVGITAIF